MKNYYKITVLFFGLLLFSACHDITTEGVSRVTFFVTFELEGGEQYLLPVGTPFVEPGMRAFENGVDVSSEVEVTGVDEIDPDRKGFYDVVYSAVNVDGFPSSITRTVIVYDPTIDADISGDYLVDADLSHRLNLGNETIIQYSNMAAMYGGGDFSTYVVRLGKVAPGIFSVSDFFGGYYSEGRAYKPAYAYEMKGYVALNTDNTLELCSSSVVAWGDSLDDLEDASYDPDTETVQWGAIYAGWLYSFNVVLNKK